MPELSGVQWCERFPESRSINDLTLEFHDKVTAFVAALDDAKVDVNIASTYRPAERAYLMHYACMIADAGQDPTTISNMMGVDISWVHPGSSPGSVDFARSRNAARQMKLVYGIVYPPALVSRHTQRRAIDMRLSWSGPLVIRNKIGEFVTITSLPRKGENQELIDIGRSYGVIKLLTDPPHWSDDGH